jgi:hypothetical protein
VAATPTLTVQPIQAAVLVAMLTASQKRVLAALVS